jgi:uncharacterized protein DUF6314
VSGGSAARSTTARRWPGRRRSPQTAPAGSIIANKATSACPLDAERRYIFEETENVFAVLFAETPPRLFHPIALEWIGRTLVGNGTHLCGDDHYDSRYEFHTDGTFTIRHAVTGPRKHYAVTTRYSRVAITASPA